jgi:hypothetical protein
MFAQKHLYFKYSCNNYKHCIIGLPFGDIEQKLMRKNIDIRMWV